MKKIVVNVPDDLHAALARHREQTGVPVSEYIRRALRLALFADEPKIEMRLHPVLVAGESRAQR